MKKIFINAVMVFALFVHASFAADLFSRDEPVQDGINVFETSAVFSEIYEKLESVGWAGKSQGVAIEGLEKLHPDIHIAASDERVIFVWKDNIIGNWPKPKNADEFGQITTAIVLKLRGVIPDFVRLSTGQMYSAVVSALLAGIDENGRYVYSKKAEVREDGRILTSVGLEGARDEMGNFRIKGVIKDSPADNAGIKEGDIITNINGTATEYMTDGDLASAFAGFTSGTLKIGLLDGFGARSVVLRRATVVLADADVIVKEPMLEIVVHKVTDRSVAIVAEALAKHNDNTIGIVLDLRSCGGDDERAAAKLAGMFMGMVRVLRVTDASGEEVEVIPGGDAMTDKPVVVLISGATTGTAEALASAFYENIRGVLVGTPTAGESKLATRMDLSNGGRLEVFNRVVKSGRGIELSGRGMFPTVCLSNIRNTQQRMAFFVNIINGDFNATDFNKNQTVDVAAIRKGCPEIVSGTDEDIVAAAISAQILTDGRAYDELLIK